MCLPRHHELARTSWSSSVPWSSTDSNLGGCLVGVGVGWSRHDDVRLDRLGIPDISPCILSSSPPPSDARVRLRSTSVATGWRGSRTQARAEAGLLHDFWPGSARVADKHSTAVVVFQHSPTFDARRAELGMSRGAGVGLTRENAAFRRRSPWSQRCDGESTCKRGSVRRTVTGIRLCGHPSVRSTWGHVNGPVAPRFDLAPGGGCRAARVTPDAGALLPHRFTLTCAGSPRPSAVCSLLP